MERRGVAHLPLHGGHCPPWLFARMRELSGLLLELMIELEGRDAALARLSDPLWFQAFGCALGFDWHSSGLTTVVCAAVKEGLADRGVLGFFVAGGKGAASRKTPEEIERIADRIGLDARGLVRASRLAAKVDNTALQDGYELYHHAFFFTSDGKWAVVQQGLDPEGGWARRYHWLGDAVRDFTEEPHAGIADGFVGAPGAGQRQVANWVHRESRAARRSALALAAEPPARVRREFEQVLRSRRLDLPRPHAVPRAAHLERVLNRAYELAPPEFAELLLVPGMGPKSLRALGLLAEVLFGAPPSFREPTRYTFAHGGKDGHPFPVRRDLYDQSIESLRRLLSEARIGPSEKNRAFRRLAAWSAAVAGTGVRK